MGQIKNILIICFILLPLNLCGQYIIETNDYIISFKDSTRCKGTVIVEIRDSSVISYNLIKDAVNKVEERCDNYIVIYFGQYDDSPPFGFGLFGKYYEKKGSFYFEKKPKGWKKKIKIK